MFAIIKVISDIRKGDPGAPQIRKLGPGAQWVLLFYLGSASCGSWWSHNTYLLVLTRELDIAINTNLVSGPT